MSNSFIEGIKRNLVNILGWRTNRKIVVFESDDWGMIRTSSISAFNELKNDYPLEKCAYSSNDALERDVDILGLLEIFNNNKSSAYQNNTPKLTLNYVMFNPDFDKISNGGFNNYHRESLNNTYSKYLQSDNVLKIVQEGILNEVFIPQFHSTEHVNINNWMLALRNGDPDTLKAFHFDMANLHKQNHSNCQKEYLDAFGYRQTKCFESLDKTVAVGLNEFNRVFAFQAKTMISPCYIWDDDLESAAMDNGIIAFQGSTVQKVPIKEGFKKRRHFMGQKGRNGQRYFIRNCHFERVNNPNKDWVDSCLADIETAFTYNKPAIISTHRVNYIGRLKESNRTLGLKELDLLLKEINKRWPDMEYLSTSELLDKYYN